MRPGLHERRLAGVAVLAALGWLVPASPALHAADVPFDVSYAGTYLVQFGAGSTGNHKLEFHGTGVGRHLGYSAVDGRSEMAPGSAPNCTEIVNDAVTLTAADGDTLSLVNSGEDCMYLEDGQVVIRGTGVMQIVGGTGRFAGASGRGTWVVTAPVTAVTGTTAEGTFELRFTGRVTRASS